MNRQLTLSVFIDALGWQLQERYGFLEDLLTWRSPLETVFGYSSTCDPTILTGVAPQEHGHFAFYRFAPAGGAFPSSWRWLARLPRSLTRRGRVRHWISRIGRPWLGWDGYFQLYSVPFERLSQLDYSEKRDLYRPGGILGGQPTIFDALDRRGVRYHVSDWRRGEAHNLAALEADLDSPDLRFAYLYLAELDGLLHAKGTGSDEIALKLAAYERALRRLVEQARRRFDEVRLLVFSDHGMTDVTHHSELMTRIEALPLEWGEDYGSVFDATMARFWFRNRRAERLIRKELEREPRGSLLSDDTLASWGCLFDDRRYGELFFLLEPGGLFVPSFMGEKPLAAMHGYRPSAPSSVAFFGSDQKPESRPRSLSCLADVMLETSGLAPLHPFPISSQEDLAA